MESSYYCWVWEAVITFIDVEKSSGLRGSEVLSWGPPFPGGRGAENQVGGRQEEATRSEETQGSRGTTGLPAVGE